jgi:hypothetical protein
MNRNAVTTVIVVALVVYGLYIASYVLPMLVGSPPVAILALFVVQTVAAIAGAVGVWQHRAWAAAALIILGAAIAVTEIIEGFVMGLISYNHALAVALLGLGLTIVAALYVSRTFDSRSVRL